MGKFNYVLINVSFGFDLIPGGVESNLHLEHIWTCIVDTLQVVTFLTLTKCRSFFVNTMKMRYNSADDHERGH